MSKKKQVFTNAVNQEITPEIINQMLGRMLLFTTANETGFGMCTAIQISNNFLESSITVKFLTKDFERKYLIAAIHEVYSISMMDLRDLFYNDLKRTGKWLVI